ncbi:MAG: putative phage tail protein [Candidatus Merdivicinus sp.]|jgi:hypothetical protein
MDYLDYLPGILRESREFQRLGAGIWPDVQAFCSAAAAVSLEGAAETASEEGIGRFERMLGISPGKGEGLEQRRFRVKNVLAGSPPFSMGWLRQRLEQTFGMEGYLTEASAVEHWLRVGVDTTAGGSLEVLWQELREKIPANLEIRMSGLHREKQAVYAGALLQTAAVYQMEVRENGAV